MHGRTSSFQKGSLQQLSDRLSWVVHPLLFFFFSVITYNWPFTNTSKNDKLETENRFYVPFITQGTLQEFFSHFSLSFFFLLQVFMSKESKRMAQSQQKKKCPQESHASCPLGKILPRHRCLAAKRHRWVGWQGEGILLIVAWASTETYPVRCLALGLVPILLER